MLRDLPGEHHSGAPRPCGSQQPTAQNLWKQQKNPAAAGSGECFRGDRWRSGWDPRSTFSGEAWGNRPCLVVVRGSRSQSFDQGRLSDAFRVEEVDEGSDACSPAQFLMCQEPQVERESVGQGCEPDKFRLEVRKAAGPVSPRIAATGLRPRRGPDAVEFTRMGRALHSIASCAR